MLPDVRDFIAKARSRIYITFDGQTTPNNRQAIIGVYVHHLSYKNKVVNYIIGILVQRGQYFGTNYARIVGDIIDDFGIMERQLGYFVLDNKGKNSIIVEGLAERYGFYARHRYSRCAYYILNLIA